MVRITDVTIEAGDVLKRNDTGPDLEATLLNEASGGNITVGTATTGSTARDLTGDTVTLNVADSDGTLLLDGAAVTIEDATNGKVSYDWQAADTSTAGTFEAEFVVDDGTDTITYPNTGNFTISITEDLG